MRIHFLEHVPFERPGYLLEWARREGHSISATRFYSPGALGALPDLDRFDLLVVMGGPMSVSDESRFPWLLSEKRLLRAAIDRGRRVLGVCLGAQLVASALGARVRPNAHKEIGWFPIELTPAAGSSMLFADFPTSLTVFHWHGDTFDLPPSAVHVASSRACRNQAFELEGRIVGLQFHLEATALSVARLLSHCRDDIAPAPFIQEPEGARFPVDSGMFDAMHGPLDRMLRRLTGSGA